MERLILFAKRPIEGRVKTRMVPPLTKAQALELYRAFLVDALAFLRSFEGPDREVEACFDGPWVTPAALKTTEQGDGDLGDRMYRALDRSHRAGSVCTVIIGADAPTLPTSIVEDCFSALRSGSEAVLSPADDGGYVAVGCTKPHPALFSGIEWGGRLVLQQTCRNALSAGISLAQTPGWFDVDIAADLARLENMEARAPATMLAVNALSLHLD